MQFAEQTRKAERKISKRPQLPLVKYYLINKTEDQQYVLPTTEKDCASWGKIPSSKV